MRNKLNFKFNNKPKPCSKLQLANYYIVYQKWEWQPKKMGYHLTLDTSLISHLKKLCSRAHKNYLLFRPNLRVTFNRIMFQASPFFEINTILMWCFLKWYIIRVRRGLQYISRKNDNAASRTYITRALTPLYISEIEGT